MTPAARLAAAIACVDQIAGGDAAERVLTQWARGARYAGSGDRAAVRDHVYDVLRRWWSTAVRGGGETGRARILGLLRDDGADPSILFTGGYGPEPLGPRDGAGCAPEGAAALDLPDWLAPDLDAAHGADLPAIAEALRHRAAIDLRVNVARTDRVTAAADLGRAGIETEPHPLSPTALRIVSGGRRIRDAAPYRDGRVELQDAASQALTDRLPLGGAARILDYCAGGGGKTLAMAARHAAAYHVHDADPGRMSDLWTRARRAGIEVRPMAEEAYDLVLVDAPCSGSGAWRRSPEAKIRLTPEALDRLIALQGQILAEAAERVRPGGILAYATCSLIAAENDAQRRTFLAQHANFTPIDAVSWTPLDGADGFFLALFRRSGANEPGPCAAR